MKKTNFLIASLSIWFGGLLIAAPFREFPIGDPIEKNFLKIAAVYFPAVPMDHPPMNGMNHGSVTETEVAKEKFVKPGTELIHMEADIHALKNNPSGFGNGEWIPYLEISYEIIDQTTHKSVLSGNLMPMIAKDGPHYGTTLRMLGKGKYKLKYNVSSPSLARHTDKLTGVSEYWKAFEVQFDFDYEGLPK